MWSLIVAFCTHPLVKKAAVAALATVTAEVTSGKQKS